MVKSTALPLPDDNVIEQTRWLWENGTTVRKAHFDKELIEAGATMVDIREVIFGACRVINRQWKSKFGTWNYTIEGTDAEGTILNVVVCLDLRNSELIFVTAF